MSPILESHCKAGNFRCGYLLIGDFENSAVSARKASAVILGCTEESLKSHPDFLELAFESFSLDDLRVLAQKSAMKPILSQKQVFILKISSILYEAVLSFSGFFENTFSSSHFFIMLPSADQAPADIRSRLVDISEKKDFKIDKEREDFWQKYLKSGPMERLAFSKSASGDKKLALEFLNELEFVLEKHIKEEVKGDNKEAIKKISSLIEEAESMRRYLGDRASYPKMIIEHFALTAPKF